MFLPAFYGNVLFSFPFCSFHTQAITRSRIWLRIPHSINPSPSLTASQSSTAILLRMIASSSASFPSHTKCYTSLLSQIVDVGCPPAAASSRRRSALPAAAHAALIFYCNCCSHMLNGAGIHRAGPLAHRLLQRLLKLWSHSGFSGEAGQHEVRNLHQC